MYPNLLLIEDWVRTLTKEVRELIIERPHTKIVDEFGEHYIYGEFNIFENQPFLEAYTAKALSVLRKVDTYIGIGVINNLDKELRQGQFDDLKTRSLNIYVAKVLGMFPNLYMAGLDFNTFYSEYPRVDKSCDLTDDGVKYYYENEILEFDNIMYRIRTFFKSRCGGYEIDPNEYTVSSVLEEYANYDFPEVVDHNHNAKPTEPGAKLRFTEDKVNLAELVWALAKSECITDANTSKPVTLKELANQLSAFLGVESLNVADSMRGRYGTSTRPTTYKAQGGKTFINRLQTILDGRVID